MWGGVDGGDDGDVVLVLEEVLGGGAEGVVEGVVEGGIEGAEGEFIDYVGEVEGCLVRVSFGGGRCHEKEGCWGSLWKEV